MPDSLDQFDEDPANAAAEKKAESLDPESIEKRIKDYDLQGEEADHLLIEKQALETKIRRHNRKKSNHQTLRH
jgi:hypothetical protein